MPPSPSSPPPSSRLWSDLPRRLLTVSVGAPLVVLVLSHPTTSLIFFQAVHLLCCVEWTRLVPATTTSADDNLGTRKKTDGDAAASNTSNRRMATTTMPLPLQLFPIISLLLSSISTDRLPLGLCISSAVLHLSSYMDDGPSTYSRTSSQHALHGILYLSLSFHFLLRISASSFSHTVWFLFVVWNGDTGALVAGRMGRMLSGGNDVMAFVCPNLLISFVKSVSPSKSMTGLAGGIAFSALTAMYWPALMLKVQSLCVNTLNIHDYPALIKLLFETEGEAKGYLDLDMIQSEGLLGYNDISLPSCVERIIPSDVLDGVMFRRALVGAILSTFAICGDLVESAVKRASGRKDSGKLLPGHGGILDRFDSTFLAAVVYWHWWLA